MSRHAVPAAAPALSPEERQQLAHGVALFNERRFYECHDTLEELWSGLRGEERSFVQGLIQLAVGFYHLGNGNRTGAARLLGRGLERLAAYPQSFCGYDNAALRATAERWRASIQSGGALPGEPPPLIEPAREHQPPACG